MDKTEITKEMACSPSFFNTLLLCSVSSNVVTHLYSDKFWFPCLKNNPQTIKIAQKTMKNNCLNHN
jgi:hypothetical protein